MTLNNSTGLKQNKKCVKPRNWDVWGRSSMALGTQLPSLLSLQVRFVSCRPYPSIASMSVSNSGLTFSKVSEPQHKENGPFPNIFSRSQWEDFLAWLCSHDPHWTSSYGCWMQSYRLTNIQLKCAYEELTVFINLCNVLGVRVGAGKLRNELSHLCRDNSSPLPPFTQSSLTPRQCQAVKHLLGFSVSLHNTLSVSSTASEIRRQPVCQWTQGPPSEFQCAECIGRKDISINESTRASKAKHTASHFMGLQQQS